MAFTGSSLNEARQLYQITLSTNQLLDEVERKLQSTKLTYADLYNILQDLWRIMHRLGLPEDMERALSLLFRVTAAINALRVASIALIGASGPVGWIMATLGVAAAGVSTMTMIGSFG